VKKKREKMMTKKGWKVKEKKRKRKKSLQVIII